ncbi:MAG: GYD domain-containing protein [Acidobacteriaceae bacterium]|nr:GYD domain-containing protein [Acidobacteriaceae bacterium]MBV8572095.1 GYD domain-containing protein [Acidobacteriaceae bacterium]
MPTYIIMSKWTAQGLQNIKQSSSRLEAARKAYEAVGIKMTAFFMTTGRYDMVAVIEAPDDVTFAKALLANASQGSFTTETCRAFTEHEYRQIISGLP